MRVFRGFARGSPGVSSGFWFEGVVGVYEGLAEVLGFCFLGETGGGFVCGPKVPGLRERETGRESVSVFGSF